MSARRWLALVVSAGAVASCGGSGSTALGEPTDAGANDRNAADAGDDARATDATGVADSGDLTADPGMSRYANVGDDVILDGSASHGATHFQWAFGNGDGWAGPRSDPVAHATYPAPGRFHAVLTVSDDAGRQRSAQVVITVTYPATFALRGSSTIAPLSNGRFAVVSPDSNEVVIVARTADTFRVERRIATAAYPRTVVEWQGAIAVACQTAGTVEIHPLDAGPRLASLSMPYASAPYGVADGGKSLFVSLEAVGKLSVIEAGADLQPAIVRTVDAITDARGVAPLPDGRVAVTRLRSSDLRGEVALVDPTTGATTVLPLAFDPQAASDAETGGVPNYVTAFVVSPTGREAVVPSLIANIDQGTFRSTVPLAFDTSIRAILSRVDLVKNEEQFDRRIQFDDRGFAEAATYSKHGDYAFVAMPGNRDIEQVDLLTGTEAGSFTDAGYAPDGVAVSDDDRFVLATSYLSRELTIYDLNQADNSNPAQRLALLDKEPLDPVVLRGKQLFNDSSDPRITASGYIACADCHLEGDTDARVWDFTQRGEGLRNTIPLLGHAGAGDGPIHWSGNFDEIQDFENDIRNNFGGTGLMPDADFNVGTRSQTLGDKKAGVSPDLDALAAYVTSLASEPPSPFRGEGGMLTAAALRGKVIFESAETGCTTCHSGARLTDSKFVSPGQPLLHDVGTLGPGSGKRLGQTLTGIDTPTLHSLWSSAPYLHDGSAPTLRDVVRTRNPGNLHGKTTQLTDGQIDDLVAYLLSLDGRTN